MKKYFIVISLFIWMLFLCGCHKDTSNVSLKYLEKNDFVEAFKKTAEGEWRLLEDETTESGAYGSIERGSSYLLCNQEESICCQFLIYESTVGTTGISLSFIFEDKIIEDAAGYENFLETGLPKLWELVAECSDSQQSLRELCLKLRDGYDRAVTPEQYGDKMAYTGLWCVQNGGVYASSTLIKRDMETAPMWYKVRFVSEEEYNYLGAEESQEIVSVRDMEEISVGNTEDRNREYYVHGKLTDIQEADWSELVDASFPSALPKNVTFYQSATLKSDGESLSVYIAPTALSEEELEEERLHVVRLAKNRYGETIYVVEKSVYACYNETSR